MKLLQIAALALCLNIPMAHAGGNGTSCPDALAMTSICAFATCAAASEVYNNYHKRSKTDRIVQPIAIAVAATLTIVAAGFTYNTCTLDK